jgi:hypothetical protein
MKKLFVYFFVLSFVFIPVICCAASKKVVFSTSSGEQTSDAAVYSSRGAITGVHVITDGTNNAKVVIYDNTAGSGTVVCEITVTGTDHYGGRLFTFPVKVDTGIYVDVTGTGASYIIEYLPEFARDNY